METHQHVFLIVIYLLKVLVYIKLNMGTVSHIWILIFKKLGYKSKLNISTFWPLN